MICAGVDLTFAACADNVAGTILLIAKKRAAAMDALLLIRLSRIKCRIRPLWIARYSAFVGEYLLVIRAIPIAAPFPNVAGYVVEPIAVTGDRFHRGDGSESVFGCIFHSKCALPRVGHPSPTGTQFTAPY